MEESDDAAQGGRDEMAPAREPKEYSYGMRACVLFDPDANMLSFGAESSGC